MGARRGGRGHGESRGDTRMQRFAGRLERALEAHDCLPVRKQDGRIVADLAEMEVRASLLSDALAGLVAGPRSKRAASSFQMRLLRLVYEVNGMHELCGGLRPRLLRLVRQQCGREEKRAFELITLAGTTLKGFAPPRTGAPGVRRAGAGKGRTAGKAARGRARRGAPS